LLCVLSGVHSLSSEYVVGNNLNVDVFLPIADRLVGFSRAAYYDRRDIPAALAEFEITANVSVFYRDEETHGTFFSAVDELEKQIVIAFRGSSKDDQKIWEENFKNSLVSATYSLSLDEKHVPSGVDIDEILIHDGFGQIFRSIKEEVIGTVKKLTETYPGYKLRFTGHSLGGALATLAVVEVDAVLKLRNFEVITFGSPRVGDKNFALYFNSKFMDTSFRVVHDRDLVAHIPIQTQGFNHVGTEVWETQDLKLYLCPSDGSDENSFCANGILGFDWKIEDHFVYLLLPIVKSDNELTA